MHDYDGRNELLALIEKMGLALSLIRWIAERFEVPSFDYPYYMLDNLEAIEEAKNDILEEDELYCVPEREAYEIISWVDSLCYWSRCFYGELKEKSKLTKGQQRMTTRQDLAMAIESLESINNELKATFPAAEVIYDDVA